MQAKVDPKAPAPTQSTAPAQFKSSPLAKFLAVKPIYRYSILALALLLIIGTVSGFAYFLSSQKSSASNPSQKNQTGQEQMATESAKPEKPKDDSKYKATPLNSRNFMLYGEDLVRANRPVPPEAARFYGYLSSVYADVLAVKNDPNHALFASSQIVNQIYPKDKDQTDAVAAFLMGSQPTDLAPEEQKILDEYIAKEAADPFHSLKWDGQIPTGNGKWKKGVLDPFAPTAGGWQRWIIDQNSDYNVPAPILPGSVEYEKEKQIVVQATSKRTPEDIQKINFWGGTPGSESPSGIWQNVAYHELGGLNLSDADYSKTQKILAQSLADAFMEVWKIKYQYWTERPSMAIPGLNTAMLDPNFPGYVSGHSAISRTAAEVLGAIYPDKKNLFLAGAQEARDSRLNAGVHFDFDNREGVILGQKVGQDIVTKLKIGTGNPGVTGEIIGGGKMEAAIQDQSFDFQDPQKKDKKGTLFLVSSKADLNARKAAFVAEDDSKVKAEDGFQVEKINTDPFWNPGACAGMPTVLVGGRYIITSTTFFKDQPNESNLIVYDVNTKKFMHLYTAGAIYFATSIQKESDAAFSVVMVPKNNLDANGKLKTAFVFKRVINLPNLTYADFKVNVPDDLLSYSALPEFYRYYTVIMASSSKFIYILQPDNSLTRYSVPKDYNYETVTDAVSKPEFKTGEVNLESGVTKVLDNNGNVFVSIKMLPELGARVVDWDDKYVYAFSYFSTPGANTANFKIINRQTKEIQNMLLNIISKKDYGSYSVNEPETPLFGMGLLDANY